MATPISSPIPSPSVESAAPAAASGRGTDARSGFDFDAVLERSRVELERGRAELATPTAEEKAAADSPGDALAALLAAMLSGQPAIVNGTAAGKAASGAAKADAAKADARTDSDVITATAATNVDTTLAAGMTLAGGALTPAQQAAAGDRGLAALPATGRPRPDAGGNPAFAAAQEPVATQARPETGMLRTGQAPAEELLALDAASDRNAPSAGTETRLAEPDLKPLTTPVPMPATPNPLAGAATQAAAAPAAALTVSPAVDSPDWGPALGQQLLRLDANGQQAELRLNPENLGPLTVTLTLGDKETHIQFVSAHASVRQAIESALPDLKATLASSGISLGQTSVSAESQQQSRQDFEMAADLFASASRASVQAGRRTSAMPPAANLEEASRPQSRAGSTVDTFA